MAQVKKRGKSWQIDYFDPNGKRIRKSFQTKKEATAELGKRISLIAEGRYLDVKKECKTRLGELLDKYEENYKQQPWYKSGKKYCIADFRGFFGEQTLVSNIRYLDLETYRNHLRDKPARGHKRAVATINRSMATLRHVFAKAKEWELIEASPFDKGKSFQTKENNQRLRFLSETEIQTLLNECPPYLKDIVTCAINSGMRKGEILGLRWEQIRNGFIYLTKTKTSEPRQIPINDALDALFKNIRRRHHLKSPYIFTFKGKRILDTKTAFGSALKRAGIMDFRFHDLRHTFASQLIMRGGTLKDAQELLGHKSMAMTLRYAHLSQEHKKKAVNLLNGLTAGGMSQTCHKSTFLGKRVVRDSM